MLHVRQGRWQRIPGVRRAHTPGGRPAVGARHTRAEAVLLPPDDSVARRANRRGSSVRLIGPSLQGRVYTAAVLRVAPRVRGVAWFGLGGLASFRPTGNPTSLGCWRLRFKSGRTQSPGGGPPPSFTAGASPAGRADFCSAEGRARTDLSSADVNLPPAGSSRRGMCLVVLLEPLFPPGPLYIRNQGETGSLVHGRAVQTSNGTTEDWIDRGRTRVHRSRTVCLPVCPDIALQVGGLVSPPPPGGRKFTGSV